jgi:hypothetical protein
VQLASPGGPLRQILLAGSYIFVSTVTPSLGDVSGLFRVPKGGGVSEPYTPYRHAEAMGVLGDTLYFVVNELNPNASGDMGGLYSCPLAGPAPCSPTLVAAANLPNALTADQGRVFYNEKNGTSLMAYAPPGPPTAFRTNLTDAIGVANNLYVDGDDAFFTASVLGPPFPQTGRVFELPTAGGQLDTYSYASPTANAGRLFGTKDTLFFAAFDFTGTTGGVVRRIPRATGSPCDLGGTLDARPFGVYADATNVYWSNQGTGAKLPYSNGSLVFCANAGCCTAPKPLWKGTPQPTDITGDADAIYFVTYGGTILKIAKP